MSSSKDQEQKKQSFTHVMSCHSCLEKEQADDDFLLHAASTLIQRQQADKRQRAAQLQRAAQGQKTAKGESEKVSVSSSDIDTLKEEEPEVTDTPT